MHFNYMSQTLNYYLDKLASHLTGFGQVGQILGFNNQNAYKYFRWAEPSHPTPLQSAL